MFNNLYKKIVTGIMALSLTLSGISAVPSFAFAKENHSADVSTEAKLNHGQSVSVWANTKGHGENEGVGFGLKGLGSIDALSTVSPSSLQIFKQEMKNIRETKKESYKDARVQLKTDIKIVTTQDQKNSAVKTYLNSILSAFQTFATAKTSALTAFVNSLGGTINHEPVANAQSI